MRFVNDTLFPKLKNLSIAGNNRRRIVRDVFSDAYNYMKSGQLMRQVINKIQTIDFNKLPSGDTLGNLRKNPKTIYKAPVMPANTTRRVPLPLL